jgi:hypothetical protein
MKVLIVDAEKLLEKWQGILKLQDWDIAVRIVKTSWRKSGDIKIDRDDKKAILMLNETPVSNNLEEVVIHELLHLKLWSMDQMIEELIQSVYGTDESDPKYSFVYGYFMTTLETTVEDLTKGFLKLGADAKEISFGRIENQVQEELKKNKKI